MIIDILSRGGGELLGELRPLIMNENYARIRNEKFEMRNEGGGSAASIYGAMPAFGIQTSNLIFLGQPPALRASPFLRKGVEASSA